MIESHPIHDPSRCIPFEIWTLAYMLALHTEAAEDATHTADRAVDLWLQKRLQHARERIKVSEEENS
jgi:hypothetical protein